MTLIYIISLLIFLLVVYLTNGTLQKLIWKKLGKNKGATTFNGCEVYLSDNIPFGLQGRFYAPDKAFAKRSYYAENGKITNLEFFEATPNQLKQGIS